MSETTTQPVEAMIRLVQSQLMDVNTCLTGNIVSYEEGLAVVQPVGKKKFADGESLELPALHDVKVLWPSFNAGKSGIKGPIKKDDPCLIIFLQQSVDDPEDRRIFDMSDAVCIMCDLGRATEGDSPNNTDLTIYHNKAYIRITESGAIAIDAPGSITVKAPKTTINGDVQVEGKVDISGNVTGAEFTAGVIALTTHKHSDVQSGSSNTGLPVP